MIQGTMSSAGKSFIVTGLCRIFSDLGYKVCPFKSQNMALNSYVTKDGYEMGRAQVAQAEAAGVEPDVRMNPILLKPTTDVGSQVIVMGKPVGNMKAAEYYEYKKNLIPVIKKAFSELEEEYDIIIVEGAGSPAEINLRDNDIVNMGLAEMLDIPVLLAGDINLGGVFAQLLGTIEWLTESEKNRIKGLIINKFRGDVNLLKPGIDMLEDRCGKKVIGVIPYSDAKIDEEDSVTRELEKGAVSGNESLNRDDIVIAVIKLPHMSNFTDFAPLEMIDGVLLKYVSSVSELSGMDIIIVPGTKSTISDLKWLKENGLFNRINELAGNIPVMGICGGYQMLGKMILDPEHIEGEDLEEGFAFIDTKTVLVNEKTLKRTEGKISGLSGFFECFNGTSFSGYEIHSGQTEGVTYNKENVFGTYVHGFFDRGEIVASLIDGLHNARKAGGNNKHSYDKASKDIMDYSDIKDREYDKAAKAIRENIDLDYLFEIMGINKEKEEK